MANQKKWELKDQGNQKLTITIAEKTAATEQSEADKPSDTTDSVTANSRTVEIPVGNQILTITIAE